MASSSSSTGSVGGFRVFSSTTTAYAYCQESDNDNNDNNNNDQSSQQDDDIVVQPFHENVLEYDHYNGVILHVDQMPEAAISDPSQFGRDLATALTLWKAERRKGIWIHCPEDRAALIPYCTAQGFQFHFVKHHGANDDTQQQQQQQQQQHTTTTTTTLILSRWLPTDSTSRLPLGPTHQIGVGVVVLHPSDPAQMLCVQEKTGPAAAFGLWKMPTGLLDPNEDIPDAAQRELMEETGLAGEMDGIVCFRQAHTPTRSSDLFFVCRMTLTPADQRWTRQDDEIADIRWMSVEDYCNQKRWQGSPVYEKLNDCIRQVSKLAQQQGEDAKHKLITHKKLPLGFGGSKATNALFLSQL
jgi:8-oxo-dGTP pyrophosphatase MutT (NUDIX family)